MCLAVLFCVYPQSIWPGRPWATCRDGLCLFFLLAEQGSEPGNQEIVCAEVAGNFPGQYQELPRASGTSG